MTYNTSNYPQPPYTYNDPRITYTENCFCYNGGFDLVCLVAVRRVPGGISAPESPVAVAKSYPSSSLIQFIFKSCVDYVNNEKLSDDYCEIKKYTFDKDSDAKVKVRNLVVKRKVINISSKDFNVKTIQKYLSASGGELKDKNTIVSSALKNLKLKPYVSSSLRLSKPRKIITKSSIIKIKRNKKDKGEE